MTSLRQQQEHYAAVSARLRGPAKVIVPAQVVAAPKKPKPSNPGQFRLPQIATPPEFLFVAINPVRIIQDVAGSYYGIERSEIVSERRHKPVVRARQVAFYVAKNLTLYSLPRIGREFNRDHTTALHAVNKIERLVGESPEFAAEVATIKAACEAAIEHVTRQGQQRGADASNGR